jgi:hypothetical protein
MGKRVVLVEPGRHLGGMTSGGLSAVDIGEPRSVGGIAREYFSRLVASHGKTLNWDQPFKGKGGPTTGGAYSIEPHVAERVFEELVREAGVTVLRDARLASVKKDGARIAELTTEDGRTVSAKVFLDMTYEGDLFALAGVEYRVGREGRDEYNEPHAGKVFANIDHTSPESVTREGLNIRAYNARQGSVDPSSPFSADRAVQAYNYRFCVISDPANRIPLPKPANYDREEYVGYGRKYIGSYNGPNHKSHVNSPILPGEDHDYPDGDWLARDRITQRHLEFGLGLMWFLQNDGSLAAGYARTPIHPDSIAITDWYMDSHSCTTDSRPGVKYDGKLILTEQSRPSQIPYRALLPRELDNMLVPVCLSATHIAWGAIRLTRFSCRPAKPPGSPPPSRNSKASRLPNWTRICWCGRSSSGGNC